MRIRLALTLDIHRDQPEPPNNRQPEPYEVGLHADAQPAHTYNGPSIGFRIPDPQDDE